MDRLSILSLLLALSAAVACTKSGVNETPDDALSGSFECLDVQMTKAALGSENRLVWAANDKIAVHTSAGILPFELTDGAGKSMASFSGTLGLGESIRGLVAYPFDRVYIQTPTIVAVDLPTTYEYGAPFSYGQTLEEILVLPCWANIIDNTFVLKHLGGYLIFQVTNVPANADRFEFKVTNDKRINGTFSSDLSAETPCINEVVSKDASDCTVTITFPASTVESTRCFYIPVPVGSYKYEWRLYSGSKKVGFGSSFGEVKVDRGQIKGRQVQVATIG